MGNGGTSSRHGHFIIYILPLLLKRFTINNILKEKKMNTLESSYFLNHVLYKSSQFIDITSDDKEDGEDGEDESIDLTDSDVDEPIDLTDSDVDDDAENDDNKTNQTSELTDVTNLSNKLTYSIVKLENQEHTLAYLEGVPLHDHDVDKVLDTFKLSRYTEAPSEQHFFYCTGIASTDKGGRVARMLNKVMFKESSLPLTYAFVLNTVSNGSIGHFVVCLIQKFTDQTTTLEYFDSFGETSITNAEDNVATRAILRSVIPAYAWYCSRLTQKLSSVQTNTITDDLIQNYTNNTLFPISVCTSQVQFDGNMCGIWACWFVWQKLRLNPNIQVDATQISNQLGQEKKARKQWVKINTPRSQMRQEFFEYPTTEERHVQQQKIIKNKFK